jgi:ubiquitin
LASDVLAVSALSITELDLLTFFEVTPRRADPDDPWPYNDFLYENTFSDIEVSFSLAAAYKDARLILKRSHQVVYELNAMGLFDVKCNSDGGRESLELIFSDRTRLLLFLKPAVSILHEASG